MRANGTSTLPSLFCVPLLVKDNIDVAGLATTAGDLSSVVHCSIPFTAHAYECFFSGFACPPAVPLRYKPGSSTEASSHAPPLVNPAGSVSLSDNLPLEDAKAVALLQQRGALVLAKTSMGEFAFFPSFCLSR